MNLFKKIKKTSNLNETGRSMVEMLGVLAVIGVLSIAGIMGYSYTMEVYKYNETVNEMEVRRSLTASIANAGFIGPIEDPEGGTVFKVGYPVEIEVFEDMEGEIFFSIALKNVSPLQCNKLLASAYPQASNVVELWVKNSNMAENYAFSYEETMNTIACGTSGENEMTFFFHADGLLKHILWPCESDSDCPFKCNTCNDGVCENKLNKVYYYGKCYVGNPCTEGSRWDWIENRCICDNGAKYVSGNCMEDICEEGASWDETLQKCICSDKTKEYDELTKTCVEKTCPEGQSMSYFYYNSYPNTKTMYKKCCPNGQVAASIAPGQQNYSTKGYCCPEGYVQKHGSIYIRTYCSLPLCEDDTLVPTPYWIQGETMYKCCPPGVEAATTSIRESSTAGVCCDADETAVTGKSGSSYCVPKECASNEKRLEVLFPNAGGHDYGDFTIPICCPQTSEYAAMNDSSGKSYNTGVCCQKGEVLQRSNGNSHCVVGSCTNENEGLTTYRINYASRNICCPYSTTGVGTVESTTGKTVRYAANRRLESATHSDLTDSNGICCEEGEIAVNNDSSSYCIPTTCPAGKTLIDFYTASDILGKICCPDGVTAASSNGKCCKAGETAQGLPYATSCVNTNCSEGTEKKAFYPHSKKQGYVCCPANQEGAYYDSNSKAPNGYAGVCCAAGETVVHIKRGDYTQSVCQKTTCTADEHLLSYTVNKGTYSRCCPLSSKAVAFKDYEGKEKVAGYCCGENAIKVNEQCVACPVGERPDDTGTTCVK